jgi:hypothetical protein
MTHRCYTEAFWVLHFLLDMLDSFLSRWQMHERNNLKEGKKQGMVAHNCNPHTQEAEAGGSRVWGQPGLPTETLSQKTKRKKKRKDLFWFSFSDFSSRLAGSIVWGLRQDRIIWQQEHVTEGACLMMAKKQRQEHTPITSYHQLGPISKNFSHLPMMSSNYKFINESIIIHW